MGEQLSWIEEPKVLDTDEILLENLKKVERLARKAQRILADAEKLRRTNLGGRCKEIFADSVSKAQWHMEFAVGFLAPDNE